MPRVLLLSGYWPPHVGGIERYSLALSNELASRGWEVDAVACADGPEVVRGSKGQRVLLYQGESLAGRIPFPRLWSGHNYRLLRTVQRSNYDAVIAMSHYYVATILLLAAQRRTAVRVWLNHAGGHVPVGEGRMLRAIVHAYEHVMARLMGRLTNIRAGVSEQSSEWFEHLGHPGATILRNAVSASAEHLEEARRGPIREVLFVGRLQPGKGAISAVEVIAAVREQRPDRLTLTIAGDGPERVELERLAQERPWLSVLGALPPERIHQLMATADLLLYPSTYPEGLPTVILEAGIHALPVVTFPVAGIRDISPSGQELFIVHEVADAVGAVLGILDEPDAARARGSLLRDRVMNEFTWSRTAERFESLVSSASPEAGEA